MIPNWRPARERVGESDLASIIYTSGTNGASKGVQLTHGNLTTNVLHSLEGFNVHPGHLSLSFLPLSHITARHADMALLFRGVTLAYCSSFEQLPRALAEVPPTIFVAVPRVYEKIHSQVEQKAKGVLKRALYRWALSVVAARPPQDSGRRGTQVTGLESCSQAGFFAGPCSNGRTGPSIYLGWSAFG